MKLFSGSANKPLTENIAKSLNIPLSLIDVHIFPDGERRIRIHDKVADKKTVVVQSAATPVDTNYMELFFIVDALKRLGAKQITAVVPYFGYQRQDHVFLEGEAVSLEVVIRLLEHVGVDRLISIDMHSPKIPNMFGIPVLHLSAVELFAEEIKKQKWNTKDTILVSPDKGGLLRVKKLSEILGNMEFSAVEKTRDRATGAITMETLRKGTIEGKKRAILVDDMISSGGTIIASTAMLYTMGIEEIIIFATHPVFSVDAPSRLQNSPAKKVYITDTIAISNDMLFPKLEILSMAATLGRALRKPTTTKK